jgi:hypothetical protein
MLKNPIIPYPFNLSTTKLATMIFRAEVLFFPYERTGTHYRIDEDSRKGD